MCVVETRIYTSEDGSEQRLERKQLCQYAMNGRTCEKTTLREVRVRIVETRPEDVISSSRASGDFIVTQDKYGRDQAYRRLSRREGKQPAKHRTEAFRSNSQSASPVSPRRVPTREARLAAPSPPSPAGNHHRHHHPLNSYCPRKDCPMITIAADIEERSPLSSPFHENDFIRDLPDVGPSERPRKSVSIRMPSDRVNDVPILSTPAPPRRNQRSDHKRHDSALGLPDKCDAEQIEEAVETRRRARRAQEERDLTVQQERLAHDEDRRRRAEAQEEARQAQLIDKRARAREDERHHNSSIQRERQKQAQDAAEAAYSKAWKAQYDAQAVAEYEKRVQSEARARERERREAEYRRSDSRDVLPSPRRDPLGNDTSPISPRRANRTALIHQNAPGPLTTRPTSTEQLTPNNDVIRREQDRAEREASARPARNDPLVEDPWRDADRDNEVREWATSDADARRARMRRHREELERRRLE